MFHFFSVDNVAFTVMGYPMSYVELIGTACYLWSVWLITKRHILTWPVGIVSVLLYMALFYQIRLYSDAAEQVYYLVISVYGWWRWSQSSQEQGGNAARVKYSSRRGIVIGLVVTAILSLVAGAFVSRVHLLLPTLFPEPASFPYLDALTTVMSFTAMWLMARKRSESWLYWIVVDIIGVGLYYAKEVRFIALLYVVLLVMAIKGLSAWGRAEAE